MERIPIGYRNPLAYQSGERYTTSGINLSFESYPRVTGRLDTCYSPVRRSPSNIGKPIFMLPLDLHVLSL
ncbi:hypothetical protein JCM10003_3895 [Bacteroides pyogenes JCM 10003]|nr:hypothetical protein JCM10003_3895 [Bacteroides pyogenes JCM 10003]